jgi:hypothetical protein
MKKREADNPGTLASNLDVAYGLECGIEKHLTNLVPSPDEKKILTRKLQTPAYPINTGSGHGGSHL